MGCTKQLKPWPTAEGPKPLICAAYDSICSICDRMVVVLGHDAEKVAGALADRPFERALSSADVSMADSICAGLRAAISIDSQATVVLQPGDHPEVEASTLDALLAFSRRHPDRAVMPQYNDRGGHPVVVPITVAKAILAPPHLDNLKQFWADHPKLSSRLPIDDPSVLRDIDTPADLPNG
jgi:CTP:molybdopterin cytidylyltransferase MocA